MSSRSLALLACACSCALLAGCATTRNETIATIEGPATSGVIARPLQVVGLLKLSTTSGNISAGENSHFVQATVDVPIGTAVIMPTLHGWTLAYGEAQPNSGNPDAEIDWSAEDHNWGLGTVEVSVVKINPPNMLTQPATQTAELSIRFLLRDDNGDDPWFGGVDFSLLCLGVPGATPGEAPQLSFEPARFVIMRR